jgi:hypothetical protein
LLLLSVTASRVLNHVPQRGPTTLKRLILLISVTVLFTPCLAGARPGKDDDHGAKHRKISADELTLAGVGLAADLGAAGFLVLRRRKSA